MRAAAVALLCLAMVGQGARAEERPQTLVPAPLRVANDGTEPLSCGLLLAHWFRLDPAPIPPGGEGTIPLEYDPATEAVYVLNDAGHPMAVEVLFCGRSSEIWPDVTILGHRALAQGGGAVLRCGAGPGGRPECRAAGAE